MLVTICFISGNVARSHLFFNYLIVYQHTDIRLITSL